MSKFNFNIDIADNDLNNGLQKRKFNSLSQKQSYDKSLLVDLGLPSRTLWAKHNIGANLESDNPHEFFGNYYAWGETAPKDIYDWNYYKYAKQISSYNNVYIMTKYNDKDKLINLMPEDDIATVLLGDGYHIPTIEQWEELTEYTTLELDIDEEYKTIMFILTSKVNGKKLGFFGSGRYVDDDKHIYDYDNACLWSSTIGKKGDKFVSRISFNNSQNKYVSHNISEVNRYIGYPVRAVYNEQ